MASLQSLPQELVGHIFDLLPDKYARQNFFAASPVVSRAPSVVDQIKAITLADSMLLPSGGNPLDTVPEGASLRQLTIICNSPTSSLASCVREALQERPGLLAGLEKITINGLEAGDLLLLETVAQTCRRLRSLNIVTAGNGGSLGPLVVPAKVLDSFACLRGLVDVELTMGRSYTGAYWLGMASDCLVEALARCTTIRSLTLSDVRDVRSRCERNGDWIPKLVLSLPSLEHLALGGSESRCTLEDFASFASTRQVPSSQASIRSLCIGEIGVHELANFLSSMSEATHDNFPFLRSLEIQELHDHDCEDTFNDITDHLVGPNPWHGRTGNLSVSVSDVVNVSECWLLFLIDKGYKLDTVQTLVLTMSKVPEANLDMEDPFFQEMDTEFDEQRARLVAGALGTNLQELTLIHHDIHDHQSFLAGCVRFVRGSKSLRWLEIECTCHSQEDFDVLGQMACELCISATSVEGAALEVSLRVLDEMDFLPSQIARGQLKHGVDKRFGAHVKSFGSARTVHFDLS